MGDVKLDYAPLQGIFGADMRVRLAFYRRRLKGSYTPRFKHHISEKHSLPSLPPIMIITFPTKLAV